MSEAHVIGRQLFDLHFSSQKEAYNLQTKVSYLFREKLKSILEKNLTAVSTPGVVIRLDTLELDLGDIAYENLEDEFPKRFEDALKKSLDKQVEQAWRQPGYQGSVKQLPENKLLLLQLFLLNGHLPWWSTTQQGAGPDAWMDDLLTSSPSELALMLRKLAKTESVQRLVRQFSEKRLEKIVRVLEPSDAAFIIAYAHDADRAHEQNPVVKDNEGGFRKAKWLVIFNYLLIERGSQFNRRAFLKSTIAGLAAHYNIGYGELLMLLAQAAEQLRKTTGFESSLPGFIHSLEMEFRVEQKYINDTNQREEKSGDPLVQKQLYIFEHFILHGSIPAGQQISLPAFDKLAADLLMQMPDEIAEVLRAAANYPGALERFVNRSKEKTLEQTVTVLEPANAPFIIGYARTLSSVQEKEQLIPVPLNEFKKEKWLFVLRHLLIDRGSHFNTRSFIKSTLTQIASHYNTTYSKIVSLFGAVAEKHVRTRAWPSSLPVIILELATEDAKEGTLKKEQKARINEQIDVKATEDSTLPDIQKIYDVLHHFFMSGKMAWWARPTCQSDDIGRLLMQLQNENTALASKLIFEISADENAFDRLIGIADTPILLRILPLLAKGESAALVPWITSLNELLQRLGGSRKKADGITHLFYHRLLSGLAVTRNGRFDSAAFMNELLGEVAVRYGITARASLEFLADAVDRQLPSGRLVLATLLKKVHERAGTGFYHEANPQQEEEAEIVNTWLRSETEQQQLAEAYLKKIALEKHLAESEKSRQAVSEAEVWIKLAMSEDEEKLNPFVPQLTESQLTELVKRHFPSVDEQKIKALLRKYKKAFAIFKRERWSSDEQLLLDALRGQVAIEPRAMDELIKRLLRNNPAQLRRILMQQLSVSQLRRNFATALHETTLVKVLALLYGPSSAVPLVLLSDVLLLVKELVSKKPGSIPLVPIRDLCLLLALRKSAQAFTSLQWLQVILRAAGIFSGSQADELAVIWKQYLAAHPGEWKSEFPVLLNQLSDPLYLKRLGDTFLLRLEKIKEQAAADERRLQMEERKEKQKIESAMDEERGVFIRNAGLILLWPFLSQLFIRVELVKGISFVSESAAYRAVHLLQYLVDKSEQTPEYNLVLNKLLCNISKAKPVEKDVVLTAEEKTCADQLIGAAIKHWNSLGQTSADGLRETFLQRGGQLFFFDTKYELRVERKAFDKLLSKLPWSISPIKLPWMNKPLYVEWKT